MNKVLGIDLGTTNSCVAVLENGKPFIISNSEGFRTTSSVVAFTKAKDQLIGQVAKRQAVMNPENTFYSAKRFIGRCFNEVGVESKEVSYSVEQDDERVIFECPILGKSLCPEEISARVLKKLADDASDYLGERVTHAVITVPAYFNDSQRQATRDAGEIAGLDILWVLNEPTAAALAYGLDKKSNERILVFDLGGGTFDVSVLEVGDGVFEVLSTSGDTHLGGDDFDKVIVDHLADSFKANEGIDLRSDKQALQRLTEAAEKAKIELSSATQSEINLPFITATPEGPKHLDLTLTRTKFEELASKLIDRCRVPMEQALADAKISGSELDHVILVGGSTRIPSIENFLINFTGKKPRKAVNPDEAVALGAAIHGGVLAGEVKDILLLDVNSMTLGIRTQGDQVSVMIPRNTTIPTKRVKRFTTATDNQANVKINIVQGESPYARLNKSLGIFKLDNLTPAAKGETNILVTFDINASGMLSVTAVDENTGASQFITVSETSILTKAEVEKISIDLQQETINRSKACGEGRPSHEIFISYSSADAVVSSEVKRVLEERGLRCWRAPESIRPGEVWEQAITEAITRCSAMLLIWSSSSQSSPQVSRELSLAANSGKIILPYRIETIKPEGAFAYYLTNTHWVDGVTLDMETGLDKLRDLIIATLDAASIDSRLMS